MSFALTAAVVMVGGSMVAANQAKQAAKGQRKAAEDAASKSLAASEEARKGLDPWLQSGTDANTQLRSLMAPGGDLNRTFTMADYQADPGYAFRMAEGQKALERSASARGGVLGGGTLKALGRYSQGLASQEFGSAFDRFRAGQSDRFGRLSTLSNQGLQAASQGGQFGMAGAGAWGQGMQGAANATAAGNVAAGNAYQSAANTIGGAMMSYYNPQTPVAQPTGANTGTAAGSYGGATVNDPNQSALLGGQQPWWMQQNGNASYWGRR